VSWLSRVYMFNAVDRDAWIAREASALPSGSRILDVGAGPCRYRPLFLHCDYRTQDFCQHTATEGTPLGDEKWNYGQIDYVSDAAQIPVPDAAFDTILCTEVLEHVTHPIDVVREFGRILRPGGTLLLSAPLGSGLHQEPDHYYGGFTPYWYMRFLGDAGFERIEITANGGFFRHYAQESQRFSALLDPRRLRGVARFALAPLWLTLLPYHRVVLPLFCHFADRLDTHRGFTVGYHIRAIRALEAGGAQASEQAATATDSP
jgi:SAM-dependent methyltransferase